MPLVTASESGAGQTERPRKRGTDVEFRTRVSPSFVTRSLLKRSATKRDSRVEEARKENGEYPE